MTPKPLINSLLGFCLILCFAIPVLAAEQPALEASEAPAEPNIGLSENMTDAMAREAARVKAQFQENARSMFERQPLGWDWSTIDFLYKWALTLPSKVPVFVQVVIKQSRILGFAGSILMLTFIIAIFYSWLGQARVLARIELMLEPVRAKLPKPVYPFFISAVRIVVAALFPLLLLLIYLLINAMVDYQAPWFQIAGRLLGLWAMGAVIINLLRESLTRDLFTVTAAYGKTIFNLTRLVVLYAIAGIALFWSAEVFPLPVDVLALLRFVVSISIVLVLFLLHLKKKAMLSLLPELPYASYKAVVRLLGRYYFPVIFFSLLVALLWCFGYRALGRTVLVKIWSTGAAYLVIMVFYHILQRWLKQWHQRAPAKDETAHIFYSSSRSILLYVTVIATAMVVLNMLGLLGPLQQLMSFPVFQLGASQVTFWTLVKAVLILMTFLYVSRLLQAYLDYKIYPNMGVDAGLGYALNTFLKYFLAAVGVLTSLKIVGVDLRFLLVFAGAIGIGVGLGLQNMASNIISGFTIIFGGKIRKDDWIEVGGTMGRVTDIYLGATKVRTRDNIEFLIPNSDFISGVIINYSLSSPHIRLALPVGVSYDADPRLVEQIMLDAATAEEMVAKTNPPAVRFIEYGDNSINFELLFWIDVRKTARRRVKSALYFAIFEALKKAQIEIPYPQRDVHIITSPESPDPLPQG